MSDSWESKAPFVVGNCYAESEYVNQRDYNLSKIINVEQRADYWDLTKTFNIHMRHFNALSYTNDNKNFSMSPSHNCSVNLGSTLQSSDDYKLIDNDTFDAFRRALESELYSVDKIPGQWYKSKGWWGEVIYCKVLDTPKFHRYVPKNNTFEDDEEYFYVNFNEWRTAQTGFSTRRSYFEGDARKAEVLNFAEKIDGSEFFERRKILVKLLYEDAQGFYDFVPDPYKKKEK